jgi:Protein of unknown function (DUF2950)
VKAPLAYLLVYRIGPSFCFLPPRKTDSVRNFGGLPLPIPIVKQKGKWTFDIKVGREEILNRRIGTNELDAIAICRGFVEAQQEYAQEKHDDSTVNQYAHRIISTPGKHDGLAWQNPDGTWGGPVGEGVAKAIEQGYSNPDLRRRWSLSVIAWVAANM